MSFLNHAQAYGLIIRELISDGRWHRVPTDDKPRKRNGAYLWDGERGVVKNWATMESFSGYPSKESRPIRINRVFRDDDALKHARAAQEALRQISEATLDKHPYLARKGFPEALGLVLDKKLLVPMRDYKSGQVISLQSIGLDKKFLFGGRAKGAIFTIGNKGGSGGWWRATPRGYRSKLLWMLCIYRLRCVYVSLPLICSTLLRGSRGIGLSLLITTSPVRGSGSLRRQGYLG